MTEEEAMAQATDTYDLIVQTIEQNDLPQGVKQPEELAIIFKLSTQDMEMDFILKVYSQNMVVKMMSMLPFTIPKDKRAEISIAVNALNMKLGYAYFMYDPSSDNLFFQMTSSYINCPLNSEIILFMINYSFAIVDEYNDKFLRLAMNMMSLEQFMDFIEKGE